MKTKEEINAQENALSAITDPEFNELVKEYGHEWLIYSNLWEVEERLPADRLAVARAYRMEHIRTREALSRMDYAKPKSAH